MTEKDITICGHGSGRPSLKNLNTYNTSRYKQKATNGVRKGLVEVRRPVGITDKIRQDYKAAYTTILGRNYYSTTLRKYVFTKYTDGRYYSDCSSSQCASLKQAGIKVTLLNTAGIHDSAKFETLPAIIENGHLKNPEILQVGDQLLYAGNDPHRPLQIGHVEGVYEIKDPEKEDAKKAMILKGQKDSMKYLGNKISADGIRGPETRKQAVKVLQKSLNNDYASKLDVDGIIGPLTRAALKNKVIKKGQRQYLVTAAEILLELLGKDPRGVEYPGIYGDGLAAAAGSKTITGDMLEEWTE